MFLLKICNFFFEMGDVFVFYMNICSFLVFLFVLGEVCGFFIFFVIWEVWGEKIGFMVIVGVVVVLLDVGFKGMVVVVVFEFVIMVVLLLG